MRIKSQPKIPLLFNAMFSNYFSIYIITVNYYTTFFYGLQAIFKTFLKIEQCTSGCPYTVFDIL